MSDGAGIEKKRRAAQWLVYPISPSIHHGALIRQRRAARRVVVVRPPAPSSSCLDGALARALLAGCCLLLPCFLGVRGTSSLL